MSCKNTIKIVRNAYKFVDINKNSIMIKDEMFEVLNMFDRCRNIVIRIAHCIVNRIEEHHKNARLLDLMGLLANVLTLTTYCTISPILAEYQGKKIVYWTAVVAIVIMLGIAVWEFICLIEYDIWKRMFDFWRILRKRVMAYFSRSMRSSQLVLILMMVCITAAGVWVLLLQVHKTEYYASIAEVYGIPVGVGEPLSAEERRTCSNYWKIEDYLFQGRMIVTYGDSYSQSNIIKKYSSLYNGTLFQPADRMIYKYRRNKGRFLALENEHAYMVANDNKFREPVEISYFNGNGKLLLKLKKKDDKDEFSILHYSSDSMPQLLNSTLLRIPSNEEAWTKENRAEQYLSEDEKNFGKNGEEQISRNAIENSILLQQIEVSYNAEGLPETRRINPHIYNLYGVNGEKYIYDRNKQLIAMYYLDINGNPVCNRLGIMMVSFEYGEDNRLACIRYFSDENRTEKVEGFNRVFCEKYTYDAEGNLCQRIHLGRNENKWYDQNGVCEYQYIYDHGRLTREIFLDVSGNEIRKKKLQSAFLEYHEETEEDGRRMITVSFDSVVSSTKQSASDTVVGTRNKRENKEDIMSVMTPAVVSHANEVKKDNKAENGDLKQNADISGTEERDDTFKSVEQQEETLDIAKIDLEEENGFSRSYTSICYLFDPDKRIAETSYYNGTDKVLNEEGFFKEKIEYDSKLRVERKLYFDENEKPCAVNGGYSQVNIIYAKDDGDVKARIEYRDKDENLTLNTREEYGYSYVTYKPCEEEEPQDQSIILLEYYDQENKLMRLPQKGYAKIRQTYNRSGFLIREAYFVEDKDRKECPAYRKDYMVAEIAYEYSDDGNRICIEYRDDSGNPINRRDAGYAKIYQEFESGYLVGVYYKGYKDQIMVDVPDQTTGIASAKYVYANGRKKEDHYFDTKGVPALRSDLGYAVKKYDYNSRGLISGASFYDTDGNLTLCKDTGCAAIQYEYDELDRQILCHFYGTDRKSIISLQYYCAGMQYQYDDKGNKTDIQYLDKNDNLMLRIDLGYAWIQRGYDEDGNIIRENYLDQDKNPIESKEGGYAFYKGEYENRNLVRTEYRDKDEKLVLRKDKGYAVARFEYLDSDHPDKCTTEYYYDDGENPVISMEYHCAGFKYEYDKMGNRKTIWYLDYDDVKDNDMKDAEYGTNYKNMIRHDFGYAKACRKYDDFGNLTEESYFDPEGNPVLYKEGGYASFEDQFNENGYCERSIYRNEKGDLVLRKDTGYAAAEYKYDDFGRWIWVAYYGTDYNPEYEIDHEDNRKALIISTMYGCAGFRYQYDEVGNRTDISYVDTDGNIMVRRDRGYAREHREYDGLGNLIEVSYYDVNNNPVTYNSGGFAVCKYTYQNGKFVENSCYDANGNLVLHKDEGCAVRRIQYNSLGQRISDSYYGIDGKPVINMKYHCSIIEYEYDCLGNETDIRYKDTRGKMMIRSDLGYAHRRSEYDDRGNVVKEAYYDTEERLTLNRNSGIAYFVDWYDDKGNWSRCENYGKNRELKIRKDRGYAVTEIFYDKYGKREREYFYGEDGKTLIISPEYRCAGFEYEYDTCGNQESITYIGLDRKPMNGIGLNYSQIILKTEYDSVQNLETESGYFLDSSGKPAKKEGRGDIAYEDVYQFGNWVKSSFYEQCEGEAKKLTIREDEGYAVIEREFDKYGNLIQVSYRDVENELMIVQENGEMTCAGYVYKCDEKGNRTEVWYLDSAGTLMTREDLGYAQVCLEYDEQGNKIEERYYSMEHKPALDKNGGYASYDLIYENGHCVETRYYDEKKNLVLRSDECYAVQKEKFDELGRRILSSYFDTEGKPVINTRYCCSVFEYRYDELGNNTDIIYRDTEGSIMVREDLGFAWIERKYDEWGRMIVEKYYDVEKNPTTDKTGHAEIRYEYDEWGIDTVSYFDLNGMEIG